MNRKTAEAMCKKYAKIIPRTTTFDVGDGWAVILNSLFQSIVNYINSTNKGTKMQITTIKEKFGTLRVYVYTDHHDPFISGLITATESLSAYICEDCGRQDAKLVGSGWKRTLCPTCEKKHESR
jgi:hypothetical protein